MSEPLQSDRHVCPRCEVAADPATFAARAYRCAGCNIEIAHLDLAPNGTVRGVIGWLRSRGDALGGRYRIAGVLGRGGFGVTYLVEDLRLKGKRRALKEIPALFYDEAETGLLTRLQHPAVPDIIDRFEADGMMYLVLEFGGHRTLEDERRRRDGTIPVGPLLPWMRQLCDVLAYLHGQDPPVVHRDLKPENVLLDEHDRIMLIDFGIAKESGEFAVTRTIARSASHGFSPPEQVLGTGTDERSDVYALGATMYALLTGKAPPPAHERVAGRELEPPRSLAPSIPAPLEAAILQALNLNIHHRQQSIRELASICEPGAIDALPPRAGSGGTVPTARLAARPPQPARVEPGSSSSSSATAPATASATPPAPSPVPVGARSGKRLGIVLAPAVLLAVGAAWLFLGNRQAAEESSRPPGESASAPGKVEAPPPPAVPEAEPSPPPTRPRARQDSGSATRAYEEAMRGRQAETRPTEPAPRTPSLVERVREALIARGLTDVTVEQVGNRVRLGNLGSDADAKRAIEVASSVVDPGTGIDAPVTPRPRAVAADRPLPPRRPPTAGDTGDADWGAIRREGATRTD